MRVRAGVALTVTNSLKRALKATAAFGMLASLLALAGCNTPTYGTGKSPEMSMIQELTGNLAGGQKKKEPIEYKARSELVLPPSSQLPPPEQKLALSQTAAWPDDPDRNRKATNTSGEIPEEFRRGRLARGSRSAPDPNVSPIDVTEMNTAQRLEAQRKFREQRAAMNSLDPTERKYLTDPPVEYRVPSANAPQPDEFEESTEARTLFGSLWKRWRD